MIDMKLLAGVQMFDALGPNQRHAMASVLKICQLSPRDTLFKQGDRAHSCYWILEGNVDVQAGGEDRKHLARLRKGELLGEIAMLDGGRRSATCVGGSRGAVLAQLDAADFDTLFESGSQFANRLMEIVGAQLAARFRRAVTQLTEAVMSVE